MVGPKWLDKDVSLDPIKDLTIAVLGYGIQGSSSSIEHERFGY